MSHYHYHMNTDIGEIKCALWHILWYCVVRIEKLEHAWFPGKNDLEQPIYASVTEFKCNYILGH